MRDGLLGLRQPRRDGLAHAVERHFLEWHVAIEREDVGSGRPCCAAGAAAGACAMPDSTSRATMRPCGPEPVMREQIDAVLAGQPARQRRHRDPAADPRRTEIAFGRADFAEQVHRCDGLCGDANPNSAHSRASGNPVLGSGSPLSRGRTEDEAAPASFRAGFGCAASPSPRITATTAPTFATSPTWTLISESVPPNGRRHLHRGLVGLDLEQVVARRDGVARLS